MTSGRWRAYHLARAAHRRVAGGNDANDTTKLAKSADNLDAIRKSVEDATSVSAGLWLSYLFVLFYFAVAAGAVTHTDLLLMNPVKLPFLNIELPLLAFFFLTPLLFLVLYAYTMVHFVLLAKKALRFHNRLYDQFPGDDDRSISIRDGLRRQLPSNIFVQFLAGPSDVRNAGFGRLLELIAWTTLVLGPVTLLLLLQIQFLPYHDGLITWTQRCAVMADLLIIWWLWPKILAGSGDLRGWSSWTTWANASIALVASGATFLFSWTVATFPGEWQEAPLKWFALIEPVRINAAIFNGEVNDITRRRNSWLSNTLILPGFSLYEARRSESKEHSIDLRGRHLEGAIFREANFGEKADFTGAYLQGASLTSARLLGASLDKALLHGASLEGARLQGASFKDAWLQGVSLEVAHIEGATFLRADLQGASLDMAFAQGTWFRGTQLEGASFWFSNLQGASFENAVLIAVDFENSYLWRSQWGEPRGPDGLHTLRADGVHWSPIANYMLASDYGNEMLSSTGYLPWSDDSYGLLRKEIESIPEGDHRTWALKRISQLDCRDTSLTPLCNQATSPPPKVFVSIVEPREDAFYLAFADEVVRLVCNDPRKREFRAMRMDHVSPFEFNAINTLRGLISYRFNRFFSERSKLVSRFQQPDCWVSKLLTDNDKAKLKEFLR
ncbi:pentapeptide repeat-containing protein [Methylocystis sp. 9N]|uniref:Pentapeptide repeat-containing protein n=1 Tax=Methylocystis borbori TaxID=3118750 RepID=A0ABU7XG72_9HYPH